MLTPKPLTAPSRVEGLISNVTHCKIKSDLLGIYKNFEEGVENIDRI